MSFALLDFSVVVILLDFRMFRNVEDVLMPVWWMETEVAMPDSHTSRVNLLLWIILLGPFIAGIFIFIGCCILLFLFLRRYCGFVWCRR